MIYNYEDAKIYNGDVVEVLKELPIATYQTCITSPPYYGLRDYNEVGQIGLEDTLDDYLAKITRVFRLVFRCLRDDGTLWLNMGDIYANSHYKDHIIERKEGKKFNRKELIGLPWRVAFALQEDGWILRNEIIWNKPNCFVTSASDRCTISHEHIFLFVKQKKYYYNKDAILEPLKTKPHAPRNKTTGRLGVHEHSSGVIQPNRIWGNEKGRNKRTVWTINKEIVDGHRAVFPQKLVKTCLLAGSKEGDEVLDIFSGSGTTALVSLKNKRKFTGIELNKDYIEKSIERIKRDLTPPMKELF